VTTPHGLVIRIRLVLLVRANPRRWGRSPPMIQSQIAGVGRSPYASNEVRTSFSRCRPSSSNAKMEPIKITFSPTDHRIRPRMRCRQSHSASANEASLGWTSSRNAWPQAHRMFRMWVVVRTTQSVSSPRPVRRSKEVQSCLPHLRRWQVRHRSCGRDGMQTTWCSRAAFRQLRGLP
jgi:hypothetical protein